MENKTLAITQAELDTMLAKAQAKGEQNVRHIGNPLLSRYADGVDREFQVERAQETVKFFKAAFALDGQDRRTAINALQKARPELYTKAAYNEGTTTTGQFTVPQEWFNQVIKLTETYGFFLRDARKFPMSGYKLNIPTGGSTLVTINWPGEATAPTAQDATSTFTQTTLTASLAVAALIITRELIADTSVELVAWLSEQVAIAYGKEIDKQGFAGTGSPFTGIIGTTGINTVWQGNAVGSGKTSVTNISWKDISNLINSVTPTAQEGASFYMSQGAYQNIRNEVDGVSGSVRPIWSISTPMNQAGEQGFKSHGLLMGYPAHVIPSGVFPTDAAGKANMVFGNLGAWAAIGTRQDMTMETYDQYLAGTDLSGTNSIGLAFRSRIALGVTQASAFGILKTSAS